MLKVEIKVSRIGSGVHEGFWQWRMRRARPNVNNKWITRSAQPFTDTYDANKSARRMGVLMEDAGAEVEFVPAVYDFPAAGRTRRRKRLEKVRRIGAGPDGPFVRMAKFGVYVVKGSRIGC